MTLAAVALSCGEDSTGPNRPSIVITPKSATIVVDSLFQFSVALTDRSGNRGGILSGTWYSSDETVATVDAEGMVRGVAPGLAVITAAFGWVRDSAAVNVLAGVGSVSVFPVSWTMVSGGTVRLAATLLDAEGDTITTPYYVLWTSSDMSIATVDSTGLVRGVGEGSVTITATADGKTAQTEVTITRVTFTTLSSGAITCALTDESDVYCWGGAVTLSRDDRPALLGTGEDLASGTPVLVAGGITFSSVTVGWGHACGLDASGSAYCWGAGTDGQLGGGEAVHSAVPVPVSGGLRFDQISAGGYLTCGVAVGGQGYCWGDNFFYQLGDSTIPASAVPVPVIGGLSFASISAGRRHACGVTVNGDAYCWGRNHHGQLARVGFGGGSSTIHESAVPLLIPGGITWRTIEAIPHGWSCGISTDDILYCWGHNDHGMLGRGYAIDDSHEVAPVYGPWRYHSVAGLDFHTCGLSIDSRLLCWGTRTEYFFEDGVGSPLVPAEPAPSFRFKMIDTGSYRVCGIATDDIAYCWGSNGGGQLGDGTTEYRYSPARVLGQR